MRLRLVPLYCGHPENIPVYVSGEMLHCRTEYIMRMTYIFYAYPTSEPGLHRDVDINNVLLAAACNRPLRCERQPVSQQSLIFLREACAALQIL